MLFVHEFPPLRELCNGRDMVFLCRIMQNSRTLAHSGVLVTRRRFELRTHCLKGSCSADWASGSDMAGMAGFEPTNARVKVWCLTAWRHPNRLVRRALGRTHGALYHGFSKFAIPFLFFSERAGSHDGARIFLWTSGGSDGIMNRTDKIHTGLIPREIGIWKRYEIQDTGYKIF